MLYFLSLSTSWSSKEKVSLAKTVLYWVARWLKKNVNLLFYLSQLASQSASAEHLLCTRTRSWWYNSYLGKKSYPPDAPFRHDRTCFKCVYWDRNKKWCSISDPIWTLVVDSHHFKCIFNLYCHLPPYIINVVSQVFDRLQAVQTHGLFIFEFSIAIRTSLYT